MVDGGDHPVDPPDAFFRRVVERSLDATVVLDEKLRIVYASPAAQRLAGPGRSIEIGSDALDWVHPDDVPVLVALADDQLSGAGYVHPMQFRVLVGDGDVRTVQSVGTSLSDDPDVRGLVVQMRDVTLADAIIPAGRRDERRFPRMLEHVSDGVAQLDELGRIITSSGAARTVLGGPGDRVRFEAVLERCHPDDHARLRERSQQLLGGQGHRFCDDFRFDLSPGGDAALGADAAAAEDRWQTFELRGFNYLEDPVIGAMVIVGRDVTTERAAERTMAEAHAAVLRALDQRREFVATVSHELRTPIHGILGVAELLREPGTAEDAPTLAELISRSGEALLAMVDDILDLSRLEVGRLDLVMAPFDLRELCSEVVSLFRPRADAQGLALTEVVAADVPAVLRSDALRVRQVVSNLVSNAVKFTSSGEVELRIERAPGPAVRVTVVDTGSGIPADELGVIFEPFARGGRAVEARAGGSGLGLAISTRLVEALGGEMGVDSALGRGSSFWFTLPLEADVAPEAGDGEESTASAGARPSLPTDAHGGPWVLVVEDDPTSRFLMCQQLERLGFRSRAVVDGESVLDAWRELAPVAVLMDDRLPGIDGREATRRLRAAEAGGAPSPRTPVIAVTASTMPGSAFAAAGVDEVLSKPVRLEALRGALSRHVADRSEAR